MEKCVFPLNYAPRLTPNTNRVDLEFAAIGKGALFYGEGLGAVSLTTYFYPKLIPRANCVGVRLAIL